MIHRLPPLLCAAALLGAPASTRAQEPPGDPAQSLLYDHRQLQIAIARLATEHADLVTIVPVGTSRAGRKIDALRLAAGERAPGRPALLVVANIDGPWVWTSGLALALAERLAEERASNAAVKQLLETTTVYVIPRANPDAAEARFTRPLHEARASGQGTDNDRDGRTGEDPPSDVDGDGLVTTMRIADPDGEWISDPTDARVLIKADRKKGERGRYKLMPEGRDSDKDESAGEDAELDALLNRNFPHGYVEHAPESGLFATDEPEARALCEFVLAHADIGLVLVYGASDNLVEKPKSVKDDAPRVKQIPPDGLLESDAELLAELGKRYRKATDNKGKGEGDERGSFQAWCRMQRGLWCLDVAPWSIPIEDGKASGSKGDGKGDSKGDAKPDESAEKPADARPPADKADKSEGDKPADDDKPKPSDDAKRLRWLDEHGESARFVAWKSLEHPELGAVEIGGFAPYARIEPPLAEREKLARLESEFMLTLAALMPRVALVDCKAKDLNGGLWQVEAALENAAYLPLMGATARRSTALRPARVTLHLPAGARLLAGEKQTLVSELPGSGGRKEFRWLVHGATPQAIGVEVETDHAGTARAIPEVER